VTAAAAASGNKGSHNSPAGARSPGKRKRNPKAPVDAEATAASSPKIKHSAEQQQQERQERLSFLSDNMAEGEVAPPRHAAPACERKRGNTPPPIKVEFGVEALEDNCSAWIRDELSSSTLGSSHWGAVEPGVSGVESVLATSPLGEADTNLQRSVEEAMASDWMGSYQQQEMGGDDGDIPTSPLLTPTGLQQQIADVF